MTLSAQWSFSCIEPEYLRAFTLKFISLLIIHPRLLLARSKTQHVTEYPPPPQLKLGDIREYHPSDIPQFSNLTFTTKSILFKFPWTLPVPRSLKFPRTPISENCSHLGTDNVSGQISVHIFAPNRGYCLYICVYICRTKIPFSKKMFKTNHR